MERRRPAVRLSDRTQRSRARARPRGAHLRLLSLRLRLIAAAATAAARAGTFPSDDGLDDAGTAALAAVALAAAARDRPPFPRGTAARTSPARAARETAAALGYVAAVDGALTDFDYGRWTGRSLADVARTDAAAVEAWARDPASAPHGGESIAALVARAGTWLAAREERGALVCVTHPAFARAAIVCVLGAPLEAFRRIDVEPLHAVDLTSNGARWTLRAANLPL